MLAKVIEFEGIDGSGKTTAMTYFADELERRGYKILRTREVGNPHVPVCVELRKLVLNPEANLDGRTMEFIFAAMRIENQKFYASVKGQYDFIISDRGWLSHLSYTDHNVSADFTNQFYNNLVSKETNLPDAVVFLDVDPEVSLARRHSRNGFVDAIEAKGQSFQVNVLESFRKYIDKYFYNNDTVRVTLIDANQDLDGVKSQINNVIEDIVDGQIL